MVQTTLENSPAYFLATSKSNAKDLQKIGGSSFRGLHSSLNRANTMGLQTKRKQSAFLVADMYSTGAET